MNVVYTQKNKIFIVKCRQSALWVYTRIFRKLFIMLYTALERSSNSIIVIIIVVCCSADYTITTHTHTHRHNYLLLYFWCALIAFIFLLINKMERFFVYLFAFCCGWKEKEREGAVETNGIVKKWQWQCLPFSVQNRGIYVSSGMQH